MGEQTVKKHKFKKWRKPGIRMQVMLGFVLFTAVIVTLLWTFQITLLNTFYKAIKVNEVRSVANRVVAMLDESASANDYFEVTRSTNISILISNSDGSNVSFSPAARGGVLERFDYLDCKQLFTEVKAAGGSVELRYLRGQNQMTCTLTPVRERGTDAPRAGIWVRDSSAGIGTLTFADTEHGTFAGLGHAVSDSDTGTDLTLLTGEAVSVTITGCRRGSAGSPGELRGEFGGQQPFGDIKANTSTGVYGVLTNSAQVGENIPVANLQEVYPGEAEIVTTISGQTAQRFAVRIERVNMTASDPNRNLLLRITDPELLRATGGIVQGMSGSPIVQDGCLVGAVTHVLVNDPTRGYDIFAATMLKRADAVQGR